MSATPLIYGARPHFFGGVLEQASTIAEGCGGRYRQQKEKRFYDEKSGFFGPVK